MMMKSRECEKCGAPLKNATYQCLHCGAWYEVNNKVDPSHDRQDKFLSFLNLPQGLGEFGFSSKKVFASSVSITSLLYALGWFFEDPQYWLNETAVLIWVGIIPIWLFCVALLWQVHPKTTWVPIVGSLVVFLTHITVIWAIRGNLWNDHVGIAALVAGSWLAAWLLGRLAHGIFRWRNTRRQ